MNQQRFTWIDIAKGLGIFLVVLGHTIRGLISSDIMAWTTTTQFIDAWVYAFHMPLFFLLSGLLLFREVEKPWGTLVSDKVRSIAYPYVVWSVATLIIKTVLGPAVNEPQSISDLPLILYAPIGQFWFLYTLFILMISAAGLMKLGFKPWAILILAIAMYPGLLPIPDGPGVVVQTAAMAIYVAIGVNVGNDRNIRMLTSIPRLRLVAAAVAGLLVSSCAGWLQPTLRSQLLPALAVSGIMGTVALALLLERTKLSSIIASLGRYSMEIYLVHTIASAGVKIMLIRLVDVTDPAIHLILGTLAGVLLPIAMAIFCDWIGFRFAFRFPRRSKRPLAWQPMHKP